MDIYRIRHHYYVGNQDVFITRRSGDVDAKRAALYCQFKSEEWFGEDACLMNLGVAALLTMFYGFRQGYEPPDGDWIDLEMFRERGAAIQRGLHQELMDDESLSRPGLRQCMECFLT